MIYVSRRTRPARALRCCSKRLLLLALSMAWSVSAHAGASGGEHLVSTETGKACRICQSEQALEVSGPKSLIPDWSNRLREEVTSLQPSFFRAAADSDFVAVDVPGDSLPAGMPLITRAFWGRRGLVREVGLAPEHRRQELRLRRRMLQWHQRLGLATLGAMTAQMVTGQLVYGNPAEHYQDLQPLHRTLGYTTFGLYTVTAGLSLGAPPGRRYGGGVSSITIHRYLAVIHFAGMLAQPWLGRASARAGSPEEYDRMLRAHLYVGWAAYGAFAASALTILAPF